MELQEFTSEHDVVDLDKEAQWFLEELTSVQLLLDQAEIERKTNDLQARNLDRIIDELKARAAREKAESSSLEALSTVNVRIQRLRESIGDDRSLRAGMAELTQKELEVEQMRELWEEGLISDIQFRRTKAEYERMQALTVDTEEIRGWKRQIKELDKAVIPDDAPTASGRMLESMMIRAFDIQLEKVSLEEKVRHLQESRARVETKLGTYPRLQRSHAILTRAVTTKEAEKANIERLLAGYRRLHESGVADFTVVSEAEEPLLPVRSNKKMLAAGIAAAGAILSFLLILGLELLDTRIKSAGELAKRISLPLLGVLPRGRSSRRGSGGGRRGRDGDRDGGRDDAASARPEKEFRSISKRVRASLPRDGASILVASSRAGEGSTDVALSLASSIGARGERVLLVDARAPSEDDSPGLGQLLGEDSERGEGSGLSEFLRGGSRPLADMVRPTSIPGVSYLPSGAGGLEPGDLDSPRIRDLLKQAGEEYGVVAIDSTPVLPNDDVQSLAGETDGVLLVVGSRKYRASSIQRAIGRLEEARADIVGVVLNGVDDLYLESEE